MIPLTDEQIFEYIERLENHIRCVREACEILGIERHQALAHDKSKWDKEELYPYARQFCGPKDDPVGFAYAWLHHIHWNEHHWQHWMFADGYTAQGMDQAGVLKMPEEYCLEMVADWMGASKAYTGSFDMTEWLVKNFTQVRLHCESRSFVYRTLTCLGYVGDGHAISGKEEKA